MCVHLGRLLIALVLSDNLRPHHAGGTEFGNFHEEIGADAHIELDSAGYFVGAASGFGKSRHPSRTPAECIAEFLINERTGIAEHHGINSQTAKPLHGSCNIEHFHRLSRSGRGIERRPLAQSFAKRIEVDRTGEGLLSALLADVCYKSLGHFHDLAHATGDIDFYSRKGYILKKHGDFGGIAHLESERVDALVENVESDFVRFLGTVGDNLLTMKPLVVTTRAAHIGKLTGQAVSGLEVRRILGAIYGLYVKALVGAPYQFFVEIGTLEVRFNLCSPFLIADAGEHVEQLFFLFCHFFYF